MKNYADRGGRITPSVICIIIFSIYTLRDLGDLSNLIGLLSQTIQPLFTS